MIAILAAIVLAQDIVPTAPSETPPPAVPGISGPVSTPPGDLSAAPPLPQGPLLPVARSDRGETFLVVDRASKTGETVDFWTFEVFIPQVELRPGVSVVQGLAHHQAGCEGKTDRTVASAGYDEAGTPVVALAASPVAPLKSGSAYDLIAGVLCRGAALPTTGVTQGHAAALAAARAG